MAALTAKERKKFFLLVLCNMMVSMADIAGLALLVFMISLYTKGPGAEVYGFLPPGLSHQHSGWSFFLLLIFFALKNYAGYLVNRTQCRFIAVTASGISKGKLRAYLMGKYTDYVHTDAAIHIREISHYPTEFCQHVLNGFQQIIAQAVLVALAITGILIFNMQLFLFLFLVLLPPVIIVFYRIRKKSHLISARAKQSSEKSLQSLQEALNGFIESNLYHKIDFFIKRYNRHQQAFNTSISDSLILQEMPNRMIELFALLGLFFLIVLPKWSGTGNNTVIITISAFVAAAYKIIPGFVKILNTSAQINGYAFTIDNLRAARGALSEDHPDPVPEGIRSIRFRRVDFSYDGQCLLKSLDVEAACGDFIGITGPSGKGKTTLLNLLLGFLEPDEGEIIINGLTTSAVTRQQFRQHMAYVKQQPFLIQGSLLENILLDDPHPDDRHKLTHAVEVAGLREMIETDPEGLNKMIAAHGRNISGGQRQRIALARALYKNTTVFLLDEPFSELDEQSGYLLLHSFKRLAQEGRLVIMVSHNKGSLSFCDKIISLHGRKTPDAGDLKSRVSRE